MDKVCMCGRKFTNADKRFTFCILCRNGKLCECGTRIRKRSKNCITCHNKKGTLEANSNWKGGVINNQGYIMIKTLKEEKRKYIMEHVLIMEDHIGRKLIQGENVHHINGVKDDNRIENLELWTRPQPTGVRVEDAIKWANHILATYT